MVTRMLNVRPNVRRAVGGVASTLVVAALAAAACSKGTDKPAAATDTGAAVDTAVKDDLAPSAYVGQTPAWPADTASNATDADARLPEALAGSVPSCRGATPVFAADSVGPLYAGMPLANLFATCKDPLLLWHSSEGVYHPALAVKMGTAILLLDATGTTSDDVITRIIGLSGVRTAEGIGPGTQVADAGRAYGEPIWTRDQCGVTAAFASHLGLAVHVDLAGAGGDLTCDQLHEFATGSDFSHFPRGTRIAWISAELGEEE
jgi:hypothetical protein